MYREQRCLIRVVKARQQIIETKIADNLTELNILKQKYNETINLADKIYNTIICSNKDTVYIVPVTCEKM